LDKKEELDREQRKKNIIIYRLNGIDSEDAEDRRCGDSLQVHELCESTLSKSQSQTATLLKYIVLVFGKEVRYSHWSFPLPILTRSLKYFKS